MITNDVVCATSKGSGYLAHTHSLIRTFASQNATLLEIICHGSNRTGYGGYGSG